MGPFLPCLRRRSVPANSPPDELNCNPGERPYVARRTRIFPDAVRNNLLLPFNQTPATPANYLKPNMQSTRHRDIPVSVVSKPIRLTHLPMDVLRRIMHFAMETNQPALDGDGKETFLDASNSSLLRNGISLAFTCCKMFRVFQESLTGVKLVSSWQTEQNTLIAACKIAAYNLRAIHVECSAPVTAALREVVRMHPPVRHFVLIGVNISKLLMADIIFYVGYSLEKLVISAAPSLDNCVVDLISTKCQRLRYLELGGSRSVTNESLINLFQNLGPGLRGIELNALQHESLGDEVLLSAALYCINLTYIRLLKLRWVTDASLGHFFKLRAHQLTEVRLEACRMISFHTLCSLGKHGTALERLTCSFGRMEWAPVHIPSSDRDPNIECHTQCEIEDYTGFNFGTGEKALVQISRRCKSLRHLNIFDSIISDQAVQLFSYASGTSLQRLTLRHCASLGDATLRAIGEHSTSLQYLDVSYLPLVSDQGIESVLSSLQDSLRELHIIGCKGLSDRTAISVLPEYGHHLKVVRLSYCHFSRQAIAKLRASLSQVTLCGTSSCAVQ